MMDPLSCFSFQPVLHDRCDKSRGMYYPVCGMVLNGKSSSCSGGSGFHFSLLNGPLPYVQRHITVNVLRASLNKTEQTMTEIIFAILRKINTQQMKRILYLYC